MKKVATIILNRNLPDVTNALYEHLITFDSDPNDVYVIEAGSEENLLSKYCTWHATWDEAKRDGLRYCRGMNYGLLNLYKEGKFDEYDAFFLLTNDTELERKETISRLMQIMIEHPRLGILSPCSERWGEKNLLKDQHLRYFWFIHNNAYFFRKDFLLCVANLKKPSYMDFIFDGENFRGYGAESELIAKAYVNDWAAGITSSVIASENESYLLNKSDLIKTDKYEVNIELYLKDGIEWMHRKYGFRSRWQMQQYVKSFYDRFFEFHPELLKFKI